MFLLMIIGRNCAGRTVNKKKTLKHLAKKVKTQTPERPKLDFEVVFRSLLHLNFDVSSRNTILTSIFHPKSMFLQDAFLDQMLLYSIGSLTCEIVGSPSGAAGAKD